MKHFSKFLHINLYIMCKQLQRAITNFTICWCDCILQNAWLLFHAKPKQIDL